MMSPEKEQNEKNILILSAGTRNKVVQYFRKSFEGCGRIIATDMSDLAPAIYEADQHYIVPRITDPNYLEIILDICKKENIKGVLSLIDPELSLLAKNTDRFASAGVTVIGSDFELCERALNKMKMYHWLNDHGYHCARSYTDMQLFFDDVEKGIMKYPVFVKPVCGSASIAISKAFDRKTVEFLFNQQKDLMIQEFLDGQEIGADCYIDL